MRSPIDFSSWQGVLSTLLGLVLVSLVAVAVRLLVMQRVQQRRERQNRQINERLKTLIAAYKTLGGSFTGELAVDPRHLRDQRQRAAETAGEGADDGGAGAERRRRIRDAVEAALSDVILLGTAEQVRLAARAAQDMVAGRQIETAELVLSLRTFIRQVLDLEAISADVAVPRQGPLRTGAGGGRGAAAGASQGGRAGGGGAGQGGGAGMAAGGMAGLGLARHAAGEEGDAAPASASPTDERGG
ncbi:hypothetical protein [Pseudorhodoferax sp.]|uniref:hypothetical protein n=1 Tax=Pseudorhodoferax sp. TaxID=1993553 RepID=UPI0039E6E25B